VALDDASAGNDEAGGIEPQPAQRASRFAYQHALIPA
jgi:hypothetical protein